MADFTTQLTGNNNTTLLVLQSTNSNIYEYTKFENGDLVNAWHSLRLYI